MTTAKPSREELHEEIRREHDELRELLGNIHRTLAQRLKSVAAVAEMLSSLSDHIETHFRDEEVEGFFDDVVQQAPRLADRTETLRTEHEQLLIAVRKLEALARDANGSDDWWKRLEAEFHDFSRELMHHESKENELLQEAYTEDIGSQD